MGGFFVRRNSKNPLYRKVLERYVQMATEGGVPQAIFPEGGLSRDGHLREPKLGLLDYVMRGFDPAGHEREGRIAQDERYAFVMRNHKDRHVKWWIVSPPAAPWFLTPWRCTSAEHVPPHDRRADVGKLVLEDRRGLVASPGLRISRPTTIDCRTP